MDQLYFEEGYYEGKYFVFVADARIDLSPYILPEYTVTDFFENRGSFISLYADLTRAEYLEGAAAFAVVFDTTAAVGVIKTTNVSLEVTFTQTVELDLFRGFVSTESTSCSMSVEGVVDRRAEVTLSTIADLAAQNARTRDNHASLLAQTQAVITATKVTDSTSSQSSAFSTTAQADRYRTITEAFTSPFTQNTNSVVLYDASLDADTVFTPSMTANVAVDRGSDMQVTATLAAVVGVIKQYEYATNQGVRAGNGVVRITLSGLPFFGLNIRDPGFTASIWVKRETVGNYLQTIWMPINTGSPTYYKTGLIFDNNNIRLRSQFDADEPGATWNDRAPMDTDWHQIVIWAAPESGYPITAWHLWLDGAYQGRQSYFAVMQGSAFQNSTGASLDNYAQFGAGIGVYPFPGYDESQTTNADISVAQFWAGYISPATYAQFPIELFYSNGYRDLKANGRGADNLLPAPYIYSLLEYGTSDIESTTANPGPKETASEPIRLYEPVIEARLSVVPQTVIVTTSNITAVSTLTAKIGYKVNGSAALSTNATVIFAISKLVRTGSDLDVQSELDIDYLRFRSFDSLFASTSSLSTDIIRVQPATASLSTASALAAQADDRTRDQSASLSTQAALACRIDDRTRDAISLEFGAFTVYANPYLIQPLGASLQATATLSADPAVVTSAIVSLEVQALVAPVVVYRVLIGAATLEVQGFTLADGDVINFDPCREIRVPPESRIACIRPKSRLLRVDQETRTLKTLQETRLLTAISESRVNITQCQG